MVVFGTKGHHGAEKVVVGIVMVACAILTSAEGPQMNRRNNVYSCSVLAESIQNTYDSSVCSNFTGLSSNFVSHPPFSSLLLLTLTHHRQRLYTMGSLGVWPARAALRRLQTT